MRWAGCARHMPVTWATFLIGSLALAGVMPFSGFFSKDEILAVLLHEHNYWAFGVVIAASLITAFYMTRLYFRVFEGPEQDEHLHEGHLSMVAPMVALAAVTCVIGFASVRFAEFLGHEGEWPSLLLIAISVGRGHARHRKRLVGLRPALRGRQHPRLQGPHGRPLRGPEAEALLRRGLRDPVHQAVHLLVRHARCVRLPRSSTGSSTASRAGGFVASSLSWVFDGRVIDGAVNGVATLSRSAGTSLRKLQSGRLQSYQRLVLSALVALMLCLVIYVVVKGA